MSKTEDPLGLIGETVDQYELLRFIGSGNAGYVYEGQTKGESFAVKIYKDWLFDVDPERQEGRIRREAALQDKISHPNVCKIVGHGRTRVGSRDVRYLVMELVNGVPLSEYIADRGPLPIELARAMVVQLLSGVRTLHEAGVVHRDIKPANIIVETAESGGDFGKVVLTDFGVVGDLLEATQLTGGSDFLGTVRYAAPEWVFREGDSTGREVAIDVYGVGATLFEMACGKPPFDGIGNRFELAQAVRDKLPHIDRNDLPPNLRALVRQMMAKDPEARPSIEEALALLEEDSPTSTHADTDDAVERLTRAAQAHAEVWEHKRQIEVGADQRRLLQAIEEALYKAWSIGSASHPLTRTGAFHALTGGWNGLGEDTENLAQLRATYGRIVERGNTYLVHLQAYRGMISGGVVYFVEGTSSSATAVRCIAVRDSKWVLQPETLRDWAGSAEELAAFMRADQPEADRLLTLHVAAANSPE